ncbi:Uncharacterised protein [Mycolicibacterium aichiense]|nr:Uncharacterised protein [Mycolicibacterium aichiense]
MRYRGYCSVSIALIVTSKEPALINCSRVLRSGSVRCGGEAYTDR